MLAKRQGFDAFVSDLGPIDPKYKAELQRESIPYEENKHTEEEILTAHEIIKSPGIPDTAVLVLKARERKIPVISEIEFAARFTPAKLLAITGTNGKTTTTLLTHHILKENGFNVGLAGNVGFSFAKQVAECNYDYYVLEISSFQLDGMFNTRLDAGVLLNITPDHLNRYDYSLPNYIASKFRITRNMDRHSRFIYNQDDPNITGNMDLVGGNPERIGISTLGNVQAKAVFRDESLQFSGQQPYSIATDKLPLRGPHNYLNIMSAVEVCRHVGLSHESIFDAIKSFKNAPHRLEFAGEVGGVKYFNDSKATNVDAVYYALQSFREPLVWIAGGTDKGNDYTAIEELVRQKVRALVAMGKDNDKIISFFRNKIDEIYDTHSIQQAIEKCATVAKGGEVVLLSPACASFDLFRNYEDRGEQFKREVKKLAERGDKKTMLVL